MADYGNDESPLVGCGPSNYITLSKRLTPSDPDFYLATAIDTARLHSVCPVEITIGFGFYNDSLQAITHAANTPLQIPLQTLQTKSLFYSVNDTLVSNIEWSRVDSITTTIYSHSVYSVFADTNPKHFFYTANIEFGSCCNYYIKTSLLPNVVSLDSSVWVSGRINYYAGI